MDVNIWKVLAIIFIFAFIIETASVGYIFKVGFEEMDKKERCSNEVCSEATSFTYDSSTCYCYDSSGKIIKQEVIK